MSKQKAEDKSTALAAAPQSAESALALALSGDAGETGFENTASTDFVMPFLKLIQKLSPEVDASKPQYIPKAKVGQFLDTSSGELFDEVSVIPCLYKAQMVEWKLDRGGFVASHDPGLEVGLPRNEKGQFITPSGNVLIDTRYFYCLRITDNGSLAPVIISLYSTQIKRAKDWMSKMLSQKTKNKAGQIVPFPIYIHVCKITSEDEQKDKNNWKSWKIVLERHLNEKEAAMLVAAQEARTTFVASAANMKSPVDDDAPAGGAAENAHL